jgi:SAM-dependent methyltransferase
MPATTKLKSSVDLVAEAWVGSPYYADAERWTFMFWENPEPFKSMFDKLDLDVVLELAAGHGRHAARSSALAKRLILVDLIPDNISKCRERLGDQPHVSFIVNNGSDYRPVADNAVSAIYCYDAMVHFSADIIDSYLQDTFRVLKPGGRALFHHSNYGVNNGQHYGRNPNARNYMTQPLFAGLATAAGLEITSSTPIPWGGIDNLDCITLLEKN